MDLRSTGKRERHAHIYRTVEAAYSATSACTLVGRIEGCSQSWKFFFRSVQRRLFLQWRPLQADAQSMVPRLRGNALVVMTAAVIGVGTMVAPLRYADHPASTQPVPTRQPSKPTATVQPSQQPKTEATRNETIDRDEIVGLTRTESFGVGVASSLSIIAGFLSLRGILAFAHRLFRKRRPTRA